MLTAGYASTETSEDAETNRKFNQFFTRRQSNDTDFSIGAERGGEGTWFPAHAHDFEQIFFVIEGRMEITIDGETELVGPREMVYVQRNGEHSGRNVGSDPLEYLVIDHWPRDSEDQIGL